MDAMRLAGWLAGEPQGLKLGGGPGGSGHHSLYSGECLEFSLIKYV